MNILHSASLLSTRNAIARETSSAALQRYLQQQEMRGDTPSPIDGLRGLIAAGLAHLPLPGAGATLQRWQALAEVAAYDLSLLKLYEAHTDALAILDELGGRAAPPRSMWGVWCAEAPQARLTMHVVVGDSVRLDGRKAWCSGAAGLTHALVSCWDADGQPCLVEVALQQAGVTVTDQGWHAVGMAGAASVDVDFKDAAGYLLGASGAYVNRPGFWHGGAGIAACWYGAARRIAERLQQQLHGQLAQGADPHRLAQLGQIDIALGACAALLREAASAIDLQPTRDAMALALRSRLAVEAAATQVLALATRALGAGPLCREADFARRCADLAVFLRQSHAERDQAALGQEVARQYACPWAL